MLEAGRVFQLAEQRQTVPPVRWSRRTEHLRRRLRWRPGASEGGDGERRQRKRAGTDEERRDRLQGQCSERYRPATCCSGSMSLFEITHCCADLQAHHACTGNSHDGAALAALTKPKRPGRRPVAAGRFAKAPVSRLLIRPLGHAGAGLGRLRQRRRAVRQACCR